MTNIENESKTLRKFHNYVKYLLYYTYCKPNTTLFDLGCGRGGDMFKWNKCNISKVVAIDINRNYVIEAIKRYKYNNHQQLNKTECEFYFTQEKYIFKEFLEYRNINSIFDNISCMFALHYFFKNKQCANDIFKQVSKSLKSGGYFFGTVMNGTEVNNLVKNQEVYNSSAMFIKKEYTSLEDYGTTINFMISGTLYFGEKSLSTEYLIFENVLRTLGKSYDLILEEFKCFSEYHTNDYKMSEEFRETSFLNYTFAFKKI